MQWLQKHPTPAALDGCFHWYPADGDRELRARLVERMRGVEPPAVLFELGPDACVWAVVFAATSPVDRRHYTGLALADAATVAAIEVPDAAPYALAEVGAVAVASLAGIVPVVAARIERPALASIAHGLLRGAAIVVPDPTSAALPRAFANVLAVLPRACARGTHAGVVRAGEGAIDPIGALVAAALAEPRGRDAHTWAMLCEIADLRGVAIDDVLAGSRGADDPVRELHVWGRTRDEASPAALADALALRVIDAAMTGHDPYVPIAAARWHALLPAARRDALFAALVDRGGATLAALVEAGHA